ncbi:MAG: hypothetical protein ACREFR_16000 [Limisphaerales bacterium]
MISKIELPASEGKGDAARPHRPYSGRNICVPGMCHVSHASHRGDEANGQETCLPRPVAGASIHSVGKAIKLWRGEAALPTGMKLSITLAFLTCALFCEAAMGQMVRQDWRASFVPIDPWRRVGNQTNYVKLKGVQFCGKIVKVTPQGISIEGEWGLLGTVYYPIRGWDPAFGQSGYPFFFVANYPYKAIAGEIIPSAERLMAFYSGPCTYKTARGAWRISELNYGVPCGPDPVLLAAAQKQIQEQEQKERAKDLRMLGLLERDATNGDSSAQYSLGIHYLRGIGCQTNQVMGIFWLLKATAQGNIAASNDLQQIESASIARP